jgi:hypothetical protein
MVKARALLAGTAIAIRFAAGRVPLFFDASFLSFFGGFRPVSFGFAFALGICFPFKPLTC